VNQITLETVMNAFNNDVALSTQDMMLYGRNKDSIPMLVESLKTASTKQQINAVDFVSDLGRVLIPADDMFPERPGPVIVEPDVVEYLVDQLANDQKEIRNIACVNLAALVPGSLFQNHNDKIISALSRYPHTDGIIVLLGKVNSPKAIQLLKDPEIGGASAEDYEMAMARLGDKQAEASIIAKYKNASEPQEKAEIARRLGYVSSDKTIQLLAEEIRTPEYYEWHPPAIRSLRIHIIEGLHLAYMEEPVFWQPIIQPEDDSYYEKIENWLNKKLGITWKNNRPEFLYQIESPIMP